MAAKGIEANDNMAAMGDRTDHKMSVSEVIHNSNSNASTP